MGYPVLGGYSALTVADQGGVGRRGRHQRPHHAAGAAEQPRGSVLGLGHPPVAAPRRPRVDCRRGADRAESRVSSLRQSARSRARLLRSPVIVDFLKEHLHPSSPLAIVIAPGHRRGVAVCAPCRAGRAGTSRRADRLLAHGDSSRRHAAGRRPRARLSSLKSREEARGADAVVVLGGGAATYSGGGQVVGTLTTPSILRALEGARVAKLIGARLVVASGGKPRPDVQLEARKRNDPRRAGCSRRAGRSIDRGILVEDDARAGTADSADAARPRHQPLRARDVASRTCAARWRCSGAGPRTGAVGLADPLGTPATAVAHRSRRRARSIISDEAIYDYVASIYYWWKGWLRARS